jgi:4-hydroxy-3-methylbut-2-enyl diphosphate reductase
VFSAHGVPASVREEAEGRDLQVIDATCPLVAKVHREVRRFADRGFDVVLIGHAGHDEVIGTLGQASCVRLVEKLSDVAQLDVADPEKVACVTQTTLSPQDIEPVVAELTQRFPPLVPPADICYATRNRQAAIRWLADCVDLVLVIGDPTSSNSRHLREAAEATGIPAYLIGSADELHEEWLVDASVVGVSAGASTPEDLVAEVVDRLCRDGTRLEHADFAAERLSFGLPREVATTDAGAAPAGVSGGRVIRQGRSCRTARRVGRCGPWLRLGRKRTLAP